MRADYSRENLVTFRGVFLCPLDLTAEGESIKVAITALNIHGQRNKCLHLDSGRPVRANKCIQFHQKCFILKIQ